MTFNPPETPSPASGASLTDLVARFNKGHR